MTLDRRTILKGLAGSAVAAPLVWPRFAHAAPGGTGPPRRFAAIHGDSLHLDELKPLQLISIV